MWPNERIEKKAHLSEQTRIRTSPLGTLEITSVRSHLHHCGENGTVSFYRFMPAILVLVLYVLA